MTRIFRRFNEYKELFRMLLWADFILRYNNTILGVTWVLLRQFLLFGIFYAVFSYLFRAEAVYGLRLLFGLLVFAFFSEGVNRGMTALVDKSHLISRVDFPRYFMVIVPTVNALINFIFGLVVFIGFYVFIQPQIVWQFILLPFLFGFLILFTTGIGLFLSVFFVRFRDLQAIVEVLLSVFFYATPIIYPMSILSPTFARFIIFNPMTIYIETMRNIIFFGGVGIQNTHLIYAAAVSILVFFGGAIFFKRRVRMVTQYL